MASIIMTSLQCGINNVIFSVSLCEGSVGPTSWYTINLDPLMSHVAADTVTVASVTGDNVTLTWSGDVQSDWFLDVLAVEDGRSGLVLEASGSSVVIVTEDTFTTSEGN